MKRILIVWLNIVTALATFGQQVPGTGLKVGEQLPNLLLGKVIDHKGNLSSSYMGKSKFSDFRGKLIILDFWTSYCGPCISGFKKMASLQKKYNDKIQIFLVNTYEDETKIKNWIHKNRDKGNTDIIPENLPIIANAKELFKLFPIRKEIGYHVWIDQNGTVKVRGIALNTHEKKIEEMLSGKNVSYIHDGPVYNAYNLKHPYFSFGLPTSSSRLFYNSTLGPFDDIHAPPGGTGVEDLIDSATCTKRTTLINQSILALFQRALAPQLLTDIVLYGNQIIIDVKNTSLVTQDPEDLKREITDEDYRNRLSYEQIVPASMPDSISKSNMLYDLNRFLGQNFSIKGEWEKRTVPCLKLTFVGDLDKITSKSHIKGMESEYIGSQMIYNYNKYTARSAFKEYFKMLDMFNIFKSDRIIVDNTTLKNQVVDLKLPMPNELKSYSGFTTILKQYGFELVPDSTETKMFVISNIQ